MCPGQRWRPVGTKSSDGKVRWGKEQGGVARAWCGVWGRGKVGRRAPACLYPGHQPAYTLGTSLPIPWAPACLYPGHQPVYTLKGFRVLTPSLACPPRNPCLPCYTPPHCTRMGVTQAPTRPSAWMAYPTAAPDHQPWPVGRGTPRPPPRPHAPPSGMCRRRRRGMQMPTKCWPGQRAEGENNNWLWSKQLLLFYFKFSFPSACSLPVGGMLFGVSGLLFFFLLSNCFKVSCYCY